MIVMDTATAFGAGAILLILGSLLGSAWSLRRLDEEKMSAWYAGFIERDRQNRRARNG